MDSEPDRRRLGARPGHSMPAMDREQNPVTFTELAVFTLTIDIDAQTRGAIDDKHPLLGLLIVPLTLRRRLTGRHDALDAQARTIDEQVHDLIRQGPSRYAASKITGLDHRQNLAQVPPGLAANAEMPEKHGDAKRAPHTPPAYCERPRRTSHRGRAERHFRFCASEVQARVSRARVDARNPQHKSSAGGVPASAPRSDLHRDGKFD